MVERYHWLASVRTFVVEAPLGSKGLSEGAAGFAGSGTCWYPPASKEEL